MHFSLITSIGVLFAPKSTYKTSLSASTELLRLITPLSCNTESLRILIALFLPIPDKTHL